MKKSAGIRGQGDLEGQYSGFLYEKMNLRVMGDPGRKHSGVRVMLTVYWRQPAYRTWLGS